MEIAFRGGTLRRCSLARSGPKLYGGGGIPFTNGRSISVNFATGQSNVTHNVSGDALFGLDEVAVAGSQWDNATGSSGENVALKVSGSASGATLTFRAGATWSVNDSSTALGDTNALLGSFLDDGTAITVGDDTSTFAAEITVSGIPFETYDVYLYSNVNNGSGFKPIQVNGTYYTYADGATVSTKDTSAQWGATAQTTPQLGQNVLVVSDVTGDALTIRTLKRIMQGNGTSNIPRGSFAGFQIVCTGEIVKQTADVMSLNFATGNDNGTETYKVSDQTGEFGLVPVPAAEWVDLETKANTEGVAIADTGTTVTWSAKNTWNNANATDPLRKAYLDDGKTSENVGASVTVANVPYSMYDVIVYYSNDAGYAFKPVTVNGYSYTWDKTARRTAPSQAPDAIDDPVQGTADEAYVFGTVDTSAPELGKNALRVTAQDAATLTVQGEDTYIEGENTPKTARGGIAALQVVERKVIDVTAANTDLTAMLGWYAEGTPLYIRVAAGGTVAGDVTLPADAILDLTASTFGEAPIVSGALTLSAGVEIRLPAKPSVCTIADTITGKPFVFVNGAYVSDAIISGGAITTGDPTYEWTGKGGDTNWSTAGNWLSGVVPKADSDVTIPLAANDKTTIVLPADADADAVAKSVTITGPESGTATLALTSAAGETGLLTISGQMLTTGNVTVTQSADITVNGASELYLPYPDTMPDTWMPELASFQVHQATYKVTAGTLAIPNGDGDLGVSGRGTVEVSGTGAIVANRARGINYEQNNSNAQGTFRVAESGVLALAKTSSFAQRTPLETLGGTLRATAPNVRLSLFAGLALETAPVTVEAVEGATLTLAYTGSNGALLSGSENLTLKGPGSINFNGTVAEDYSGTVTIAEGTPATLGSARPPLAVESDAKVTVTVIDPEETGIGEIAFPTEMETIPDNVTFVVNGLKDGIEFRPAIESNQLVLKWAVEIPAMTTSGAWGTDTNWDTQKVPTSGMARLDGGESGIEVTLDTALSGMESIIVSGVVSLKTTETQSSIPASITLEKGATLTIDAPFSGVGLGAQWELPVGTTLRVDDTDFTGWYALNMQGLVEFLPSGSAESPIQMDTDTAQFHGGLTIAGDYVQLSKIVELGGTVTLAGNNISLTGPVEESATGNVFHCTTNTRIVNTGTGNRISNLGGCTGTFLVNAGTLSLEVVRKPIAGLVGLVVAKDATLTFEEACVGGQYPLSGEGTVVIAGTLRPQVKAFELDGVTYNTIPAKMVFVATEEEQTNGVIQFLNAGNATVPANFVAEVTPFGDADVWVPVATNGNPIRIRNVPAPNGVAGLEEAVALAIRRAAAEAGVTDGNYTVQLTTKGQPVEVTADMLNDVLGCFTNLTATAEGSVLTYAYDFGVVGIKRNTTDNGWVVTAKVQGEGAAPAGFAEGNAYTLTVNGTEVSVANATVNEGGTVTLPLADSAVQGDDFTLGVKVSRPEQTPAQ